MESCPWRKMTLMAMLSTALLLMTASCGGSPPAASMPPPSATAQSQPATLAPTAPPSPTSPPPTPTPLPTNTATTAPTNTLPPPTATSAPSATPTVAPTQAPSATPTPAPDAVVTSETLNVRSGPDTQFEAVARLTRGDALTVVGQSDSCNWLKVSTAQGTQGWVARQSGGVELVKLNLPCAGIPALSVPTPTARPQPPAAPTATPQPSGGGSTGRQGLLLVPELHGSRAKRDLERPQRLHRQLQDSGQRRAALLSVAGTLQLHHRRSAAVGRYQWVARCAGRKALPLPDSGTAINRPPQLTRGVSRGILPPHRETPLSAEEGVFHT